MIRTLSQGEHHRSAAAHAVPVALALAALAAVAPLLSYAVHPLAPIALLGLAGVVLVLLRGPTWGLRLGLAALPLQRFSLAVGGLGGFTASEALFLLSAAGVIGLALLRPVPQRLEISPVHVAFAGVILSGLAGLFFADATLGIAKLVLMWSAFLVLSIHVAGLPRREIGDLLVLLALSAGVVGLVAVAGSEQARIVDAATGAPRAEGAFEHPNSLSFFLALCLPIALVLTGVGHGLTRVATGIAAVLILAGLIDTVSRAGILGALAGLLLLAWWRPFRIVAPITAAALAVTVALGITPLIPTETLTSTGERLQTLTSPHALATDPSADARTRVWGATPEIVAAHPLFGVGLARFQETALEHGIYDVGGHPMVYAHNTFLQVAAELGLVGLLFFAWFVGALTVSAVRAVRRARPARSPVPLGIAAGLLTALVAGLADYALQTNVLMALILLLAGAVVAYERASPAPCAALTAVTP